MEKNVRLSEISGSQGREYENDSLQYIAQCNLLEVEKRFRYAYCSHHQDGEAVRIALKMEAVRTSSAPVNLYETTLRNVSDGFRLICRSTRLSVDETLRDCMEQLSLSI
jgi:hypothetical protein